MHHKLSHPHHRLGTLALAALLCASAQAQNTVTSTLPAVQLSGRAQLPSGVAGWGDTPAAQLPMQTLSTSQEQLRERGISSLAGLTELDASASDAYNAAGYVSYLKLRGFTLDNRFNYRRDGLPINAETALLLGNMERVELLKGTSGLQAGTSAPGGLVNLVVKRPLREDASSLLLAADQYGQLEAGLDLNRRMGSVGLRVNASAAQLHPALYDANGQRRQLALAGQWQASADTVLDVEYEHSQQRQRSQPGFSLLGAQLPDARAINPRVNLNNQDWSLPVRFQGDTTSVRLRQQLSAQWQLQAQAMAQNLRTDDRLAYPFGCTQADGTYWASSYCPNGDFDQFDYRSDNEHRHSRALEVSLQGRFSTGALQHQLQASVLRSAFNSRFEGQAYNWAGTGNISGLPRTQADPSLNDANTNRDERSTELALRDTVALSAQAQLFVGLRHTQLQRASARVNTSNPRATDYSQSFTTPWLGLSWTLAPQLQAYASWGQGVESEVTPQRNTYANAGQALPALRSRQWELGLRGESPLLDWGLSAFDISRPAWRDITLASGLLERRADGVQHHRGLEAQATLKWNGGSLAASGLWLKAQRQDSADASLNGLKPDNVPARSARLQLQQAALLPGLRWVASLQHEGPRMILPDNSLQLPGWTTLELGARYDWTLGAHTLVLRAGLDNALNRRAWRESPYQYEHVYLYPLAPRTLRASASWNF
ncbi:TonB-dependent siderophore receptor [Roseateles sp. BYS180W]|uniref:TonB-dependent siderophore receptor n=1 Tax=Roseateles rivi TaxID=3299028 RepID=A0ABW7FSD0_9BURK